MTADALFGLLLQNEGRIMQLERDEDSLALDAAVKRREELQDRLVMLCLPSGAVDA